jgi:hypothetical protein
MDLLLHVGLMKTGTTTLQKLVFPAVPGYLGSLPQYDFNHRDAGLGQQFIQFLAGRTVDVERWRDEACSAVEGTGADTIIVSRETLTRWSDRGSWHVPVSGRFGDLSRPPRRSPHPLIAFLRGHVLPAWESVGAVRTLVTLRNQSDWLASLYAQVSDRIIRASQEDFEARVARLVAGRDAYLDYAALIEDLDHLVGRDASHVLLLEDMGTDVYWQQLGAALGTALHEAGELQTATNVRREDGVWMLRPFNSHGIKDVLMARSASPGRQRSWTLRGLGHPVQLVRTAMRTRDASINVTDELRQRVRDGYASSNLRLGHRLGRDLSDLGY